MLLMSWAGKEAQQKDVLSGMGPDWAVETYHAVTKLRCHGVEHRDVRWPNVLWNPERRKVMLIDFERSEILKRGPGLQEISPNLKRKRLQSEEGTLCVGPSHTFRNDPIRYPSQNAGSLVKPYSSCDLL